MVGLLLESLDVDVGGGLRLGRCRRSCCCRRRLLPETFVDRRKEGFRPGGEICAVGDLDVDEMTLQQALDLLLSTGLGGFQVLEESRNITLRNIGVTCSKLGRFKK